MKFPSAPPLPPNQPTVPIIGAAQVIGATVVVLFRCNCETKPPVQGVMGIMAMCQVGKNRWKLEGGIQCTITPLGLAHES